MNTTFYLVRHGSHELLSKIMAGRMEGVHLSEQGRQEAEQAAKRMEGAPIQAIYSSPLERARETAMPLAEQKGVPIHTSDALNEVDFGEWTGMHMDQLHQDPSWLQWANTRSCVRPPGGEMLIEIQSRVVAKIEVLRCVHEGENVALFTHSDTIRSALTFYLGMPVDFLVRLEIGPASISVLRFIDSNPQVLKVNDSGPLI